MEKEISFEIMRHARKEETGELSEQGFEDTRKEAREFFKEIKDYQPGTIITLISSNIDRARDTRETFEKELINLFQSEKTGFQVVDIKDKDNIKNLSGTKDKVLITDTAYSSLIGFKPESSVDKEWKKLGGVLNKDEDLIGRVWASTPEEFEDVKKIIKQKYPDVDLSKIRPWEIGAPEDTASKQLKWIKRMAEIAEKHFPDNHMKFVGVSHNVTSDFATMELLGLGISSKSIDELGGSFRNYLEKSKIDMKNGKATVSYRYKRNEFSIDDLDNMINNLAVKSKKREKDWEKYRKQFIKSD